MGLPIGRMNDADGSRRRRAALLINAAVIVGIGVCAVLLFRSPREEPSGGNGVGDTGAAGDRPSMRLGRPEIKQFSQPQPSDPIATTVSDESVPDIRLPDLQSAGAGLLSGVLNASGVRSDLQDMMSEQTENLFGRTDQTGNELEVTFYSFDRNRDGSKLAITSAEFFRYLRDFVSSDWQTEKLDSIYQSPQKRYATTVALPLGTSFIGPLSFGEEFDGQSRFWAAHYRGKLVHKDGITFRFWGSSDSVLVVAVDSKLELVANAPYSQIDAYTVGMDWNRRSERSRSMLSDNGPYKIGSNSLVGGQWITLEPGVPRDIDILVGSGPVSDSFAMLLIEERYELYPLNDWGGPIFPLFAIEPPSWELQDLILMNAFEGEAGITNIQTYFNSY